MLTSDIPAVAAGSPDRDGLILAEQIRALYAGLPNATAASGGAAVAVALMVRNATAPSIWIPWFAAMMIMAGMRIALTVAYRRRKPPPESALRWGHYAAAASGVIGLLWGIAGIALPPPGEFGYQMVILCVVVVTGTAAAYASAPYPPSFFLFFYASLIPITVLLLGYSDNLRFFTGVMLVLYIPVISRFALGVHQTMRTSLELRFENLELLAGLRREKETADAANMAKSRFLAAASHDLRQPMHALVLFVDALRERPLGEAERRLVERINTSAIAMEGLFNALLDISRLDAQTVKPKPAAFRVRDTIERIRAEYAWQAVTNGIALRIRCADVCLHSDAALFAAIVGNLVSNAVRYTDSGGVLIACRKCGNAAHVEVWDTGPGIPPDKHREIFTEFYQIDNPERDRRKGLGLGLAIVDRLVRLLDIRLEFKSRVGRGSLFRLVVPLAPDIPREGTPPASLPAASPDLSGIFILVIDDEIEIRDAMATVIESWGCEVRTADSGQAALAVLAGCTRQPDLLITDYRLRQGETGIAVIQALRNEVNDDELPALLITGDTAPERLHDAESSHLPILHKPVVSARLKEAVVALRRRSNPMLR
jgi:signal transduction histidine kinase/CheY-like chemotaxis protein